MNVTFTARCSFGHLQNARPLAESVAFWAELTSVAACKQSYYVITETRFNLKKTVTFAVDFALALAQRRRLEPLAARGASEAALVPRRAAAHHLLRHVHRSACERLKRQSNVRRFFILKKAA